LEEPPGETDVAARAPWLDRVPALVLPAGLAERSGATTASAGLALRLDRLPQAAPYRAWVSGLSEAVAALDEAAAELRDEVLNMLGVRVGYRGELADECPGSRAHPNPRSLSRFVVWQSVVSRATILTI
jgi:hypothetical protein